MRQLQGHDIYLYILKCAFQSRAQSDSNMRGYIYIYLYIYGNMAVTAAVCQPFIVKFPAAGAVGFKKCAGIYICIYIYMYICEHTYAFIEDG